MSEFQMYVKKPIPIKVKQMNKDFSVESLEGIMSGKKGDYLAIGVDGEKYVIRKNIFEKTYFLKIN